jgi:hypothetical protein
MMILWPPLRSTSYPNSVEKDTDVVQNASSNISQKTPAGGNLIVGIGPYMYGGFFGKMEKGGKYARNSVRLRRALKSGNITIVPMGNNCI